MQITGTGIGQGVAVGPVVRMAERLPEPVDRPSHLDPELEGERARASMSVVAAELTSRGAKAGGAAQDVLEAQAMIAEDPSLIDEVTTRLARARPPSARSSRRSRRTATCSPAWAVTWPSARPTSMTSRSASSRTC